MGKIDRQIKAHNQSMQKLLRRYSYDYNRFLSHYSGNLLITGGRKERRRQALLRQIERYRQTSRDSVVVFSDDRDLKEQLILATEDNRLGLLYVVDPEYAGYGFFRGMPKNLIAEFFSKAALQRGFRDTSKLLTYTDAVLDILSAESEVSLSGLAAFLRNDDDFIASCATSPDDSDAIKASLEGGANLRDLVRAAVRAFSPLAADGEKGISLSTEIDRDCVILIDLPTENHDLFAAYFAMELRSLMNRSFKLIFDDDLMINNKDMFDVVRILKQRSIDVVLSYDNIISVQPPNEDILDNISRQLVFLDGNMPAANLQQVLSRFGQFTAMQAMGNEAAPPAYFFTLKRGKGEAPVQYQRDRVMLQELYGMEAVLAGGSCADIIAAQKLII